MSNEMFQFKTDVNVLLTLIAFQIGWWKEKGTCVHVFVSCCVRFDIIPGLYIDAFMVLNCHVITRNCMLCIAVHFFNCSFNYFNLKVVVTLLNELISFSVTMPIISESEVICYECNLTMMSSAMIYSYRTFFLNTPGTLDYVTDSLI